MIPINRCPFCKSDNVAFKWKVYMANGLVVCRNWEDKCCAQGPEEHYKEYDNAQRIENRAIKKWNKALMPNKRACDATTE